MTIEELAYLKCPNKIRTALINTVGRAPPIDVIERKLKEFEPKRVRWNVGEPKDSDAVGYMPEYLQDRLERISKPEKPRKPRKIYIPKPASLEPREYKPTLLSEKLAQEVCKRMGLDVATFYSATRVKPYVHARAIVCKVLRERNESVYSFPRIGACIAREDHSTVRHLIMNFDVYCRHPDVWDVYEAVRALDLSDLVL
jgi:hypothetical protein